MPDKNGYSCAPDAVEQMLEQFETLSDEIVRSAFFHCGHRHPSPDDIQTWTSRMEIKLRANDCCILRTFEGKSSLRTFLQQIANHDIARFLKKERKKTTLDEVPPELLVQLPAQEASMLRKEQKHLLQAALGKLTPRQRQLYELIHQDLSNEEIAREMNLRVETVYRKKVELAARLKGLVNGGGAKIIL